MRTCIDEEGSSNIGMLLTYVFVYNCVDLDMTAYIKPGASCSIHMRQRDCAMFNNLIESERPHSAHHCRIITWDYSTLSSNYMQMMLQT